MPIRRWRPLENAAKAFPALAFGPNTYVFRITCQLNDSVNPLVLQKALNETMRVYAFFRVVLKKGAFWYYLEESELRPRVVEEHSLPCLPIYDPNHEHLLFEVTYNHNRIHFEVFHVLTDGISAMQFIRLLVLHYLAQLGIEGLSAAIAEIESTLGEDAANRDAYCEYYDDNTPTVLGIPEDNSPSAQVPGGRYPNHQLGIMEATLSTRAFLKLAHDHNATVTECVIALLVEAIAANRNSNLPISIAVPVNLRRFFPSLTQRNFHRTIRLRFPEHALENLTTILDYTRLLMQQQTSKGQLQAKMNAFTALEKQPLMRLAPLSLKNFVFRVSNKRVNRSVTAIVSNLGVLPLPAEATPYVAQFSALSHTHALQICMVSYNDRLTIGLTSALMSLEVQRDFFRGLTARGLSVALATNIGTPSDPSIL